MNDARIRGATRHDLPAPLDRPRVRRLLDGPARLVVVRALHGSGKTTGLTAWDRHTGRHAMWVPALSPAGPDSDLATRVSRLVLDQGAGTALSEASANSPSRVLILDDAGEISDADAQALVRLLHQSPRLRLIVATDRVTYLENPAVALLVDRTIVGPDELMFDREEIERYLGIEPAAADAVRRATGGLPVAIRAIAGLPHHKQRTGFSDAALHVVDDYLRLRFHSADRDVFLAALARMSTAEAIDSRASIALSRDPDAEAILDEAASLGFGSWSDDRVFTFTPVLRSFLQRELQRSFSAEISGLRTDAAKEALRRGAHLGALQLAVDADDLALATHVVLIAWYALLEQHGRAVIGTLGAVPLARLKEQPLLVMLLAICHLGTRIRRLRGLQLLRIAIASADSTRKEVPAIERIYIWTGQSAALRLVGRTERSGEVASRALGRLLELPESAWEPYGNEIPRVCTQLGLSLFYAGRRSSAIEAWEYAAALASARNSPSTFHSLALLAGAHALSGDMPEAEHYAALVRSGDWAKVERDGYRGTFYRVAEALLALERGDTASAARHVGAFDPHRETSEHWLIMTSVETRVLLEAHAADAGLERLESLVIARGREAARATSRQQLSASRVLLHLARGSEARATHILDQDAGPGFEKTVLAARIALGRNRPFDALRLLSRTEFIAPDARLRAEAAAITAAATVRTAGAEAAARSLRVLSAVLADRRLRTPLTLLPPDDLAAVQAALETDDARRASAVSVLPANHPRPRLSRRERVVLQALHSADSLPAIADGLGVSVNTIKTQARSLYRKLGVTDRASAIARSHELRLLERDT